MDGLFTYVYDVYDVCIPGIYVYMHTYIHTCIHAYIHTYIHTDIHTYIHTYIYIYSKVCNRRNARNRRNVPAGV